MGGVLGWLPMVGAGLIGGGFVLLVTVLAHARRPRPRARPRRSTWTALDASANPPPRARPDRARPHPAAPPPRQSLLLADTVPLHQLATHPPHLPAHPPPRTAAGRPPPSNAPAFAPRGSRRSPVRPANARPHIQPAASANLGPMNPGPNAIGRPPAMPMPVPGTSPAPGPAPVPLAEPMPPPPRPALRLSQVDTEPQFLVPAYSPPASDGVPGESREQGRPPDARRPEA